MTVEQPRVLILGDLALREKPERTRKRDFHISFQVAELGKEVKPLVMELLHQGAPIAGIAKALECGPHAIANWIENGVSLRRFPDSWEDKLLALLDQSKEGQNKVLISLSRGAATLRELAATCGDGGSRRLQSLEAQGLVHHHPYRDRWFLSAKGLREYWWLRAVDKNKVRLTPSAEEYSGGLSSLERDIFRDGARAEPDAVREMVETGPVVLLDRKMFIVMAEHGARRPKTFFGFTAARVLRLLSVPATKENISKANVAFHTLARQGLAEQNKHNRWTPTPAAIIRYQELVVSGHIVEVGS